MWNPLSWVMEAATIMAIALANGGFLKNVQSDMLLKSRASNMSLLKTLFKHWMFSGMLHRNCKILNATLFYHLKMSWSVVYFGLGMLLCDFINYNSVLCVVLKE
uniref:Uncharacterized protein n=2 Tax=Cannabis sativa TaxID=3483 RepID=A0A803QZ99_CANSA